MYIRYLVLSLIALALQSCASIKTDPFFKENIKTSFIIKNKDYDYCWNRLVDFLTDKSLKIDIIDKESGYISLKNPILCSANFQCMEDYTSCVMAQNVITNDPPLIKGLMSVKIRMYISNGNVIVRFNNLTRVIIFHQRSSEKSLIKIIESGNYPIFLNDKRWKLSNLKSQSTGSFERDIISYILIEN